MSPKRPPVPLSRIPVSDWDPTDTQTLRAGIELAGETRWRRDLVDKMEPMAKTLGEVRDTARACESTLEYKASKETVTLLEGRVNVLEERVGGLKKLVWGVLIVGVLAILAEKTMH